MFFKRAKRKSQKSPHVKENGPGMAASAQNGPKNAFKIGKWKKAGHPKSHFWCSKIETKLDSSKRGLGKLLTWFWNVLRPKLERSNIEKKNRFFSAKFVKSREIGKTDCSFKAAGNHTQDPILAGKSISLAFQRLSRITLKLPELREKLTFLSPGDDFSVLNRTKFCSWKIRFSLFIFTTANIFGNGVYF